MNEENEMLDRITALKTRLTGLINAHSADKAEREGEVAEAYRLWGDPDTMEEGSLEYVAALVPHIMTNLVYTSKVLVLHENMFALDAEMLDMVTHTLASDIDRLNGEILSVEAQVAMMNE